MSLLTIEEMPEWLRYNKFIKTGYRPAFASTLDTTLSLFRWHNESVNVWLHLLPSLALLYHLMWMEPLVPGSLLYPACVGSCTAIMFASTAYHLFMPCCCSRAGYSKLVNCDVLSCLLSITVTSFSFIHVGNKCIDGTVVFGATAAMILSSLAVIYTVCSANLTAAGRVKVFGFHCLLRLSIAVVFLWPKTYAHGLPLSFYYHTMSFFMLMAGGILNGLRLPEKWFNGGIRWMDFVMNSHNIWHYLCIIALTQSLLGCYYDHVEYAQMECYLA
ncbi:Hypothetical protein, putative [Bodo saltans]|uniref:Uncharacterized protein n=1 Tax=Bodo saltans TaxID=75058 RepID=A0A0S4KI61_BODSA|nr:Hypothetical protein, putative [Bodo saltans]|eukprot:CUI14121.1 Hypothetical protein, putative [Bodo saltans]